MHSLQPVTPASLRHALWRHPAMTFGVIARIHWQAVRLWLKRVKFSGKPAAREPVVTGWDGRAAVAMVEAAVSVGTNPTFSGRTRTVH
mgnify:CR=1 FL=1